MADAFARGEPVPHGGERPEPNPQFLAHAAGLSELYVLCGFRREGEAREPFRADGRARARAPDAHIDVEDERARQLDESHAGLAAIAAILIGLHLAVTALAAALLPRRGDPSGLAAAEPLA